MRFAVRVAVVVALLLPGSTVRAADNFCTDCAVRFFGVGEERMRDVACCMARDDITCWGGYEVEDANVGAGCIVRVDDEGDEWCNSYEFDRDCPGSGGGGDGCVSVNGYCPPECISCRPNI